MRKNILLPIIIVLVSLSGCTKVWDYFEQHPDHPGAKCRVQKISFETFDTFLERHPGIAYYSYDAQNNPTLIQFDIPYDLWPMDRAFRYDENNKLIVYVTDFRYDDTAPTKWHKYTYVNSFKITDSVFTYTTGNYMITDKPDKYSYVEVHELTLDYWKRIIKEKIFFSNGDESETSFLYDRNGNLIKPGLTYSGKPNIRQTNKIWQFIDRDYSVNQPRSEIAALNAYGLPYRFRNPVLSQSEILQITPSAVVTYNCD